MSSNSSRQELLDSRPRGLDLGPTGRGGDRLFSGLARGSGLAVIALVVFVAAFLLWLAVPALKDNQANFLFSRTWQPGLTPPVRVDPRGRTGPTRKQVRGRREGGERLFMYGANGTPTAFALEDAARSRAVCAACCCRPASPPSPTSSCRFGDPAIMCC